MVMLACSLAARNAGKPLPLLVELNAGIAFLTRQGEKFPHVWRGMEQRGERMHPTQFESIIHNSAPGYSAIELGLIGPQLALVEGDLDFAARLQLKSGRSRFMLVCEAELDGPAKCYALEVIS